MAGYFVVVCKMMYEMMKNVKHVTIAPGLRSMVNSSDKRIHTLPDSSAEVDNILFEIMLKNCHSFSFCGRMGYAFLISVIVELV